eukprot:559831-Pleurochrysis_carterae.AAC.1
MALLRGVEWKRERGKEGARGARKEREGRKVTKGPRTEKRLDGDVRRRVARRCRPQQRRRGRNDGI